MMQFGAQEWLNIFDAATNVALLGLAWKASSTFTELAFKVNMMWKVFSQKFERRGDEFVSRPRRDER